MDAVRDALSGIAALYTMASERTVHVRFLLPGMESLAPPTAAAASEDDLFEDAFFLGRRGFDPFSCDSRRTWMG